MRGRARLLAAGTSLLAGCHTIQSANGGDARQGQIFNTYFAAFLVVTSILYIIGLTLTDICYALVDPRIRLS